MTGYVLEPAAQAFADAADTSPDRPAFVPSITCDAVIHDVVVLNPVRATAASAAAIELAIPTLRKAFGQ